MFLNRERFGVLNKDTANVIEETHQLRLMNPEKGAVGPNDFLEQMDVLYEAMWQNKDDEKVYVFTKKPLKKIMAMDAKPLIGPVENISSLLRKDETGYIVLPSESGEDAGDCNMAYTIKDGKLYANICIGEYKAGYIIADKDFSPGAELIPWGLVSMLRFQKFCKQTEAMKLTSQFELLAKDFPDIMKDPSAGILKASEWVAANPEEAKKNRSHEVFKLHGMLFTALYTMFRAFVFLKTSETYTQEYIPAGNPPTYFRKKGYKPLGYIQVDVTWDMDIDVNRPFPVRGHFVHQPCKINGEWTRKLIYVDQYMKKGYHRRAKKTIEKKKIEENTV